MLSSIPSDVYTTRTEEEVFNDLARLASRSGFAHVIAAICFRDNFITIEEELDSSVLSKMFSEARLIRTEVATLIGLMVKYPIDIQIPEPQEFQDMIDQTDKLMKELHYAMYAPAIEYFRKILSKEISGNPLTQGAFLREAIFYGGESAYLFQYRDLSVPKYSADNKWLNDKKGFSINDAHAVVTNIINIQNEKLKTTFYSLRNKPAQQWTLLPAFTFSSNEIASKSDIPLDIVCNVLAAFSLPTDEKNSGFQTLSDFNITNAHPLIPVGKSEYLCFQSYSIAEALYESPFYWMLQDKTYITPATDHRGTFNEEYCAQRLIEVFGHNRVFKNVTLYHGRNIVAEIDVLVFFADRIIIVQAKSKRLTIEARRGNDNKLRDDFKRSIQAAYDQGLLCAKLLLEKSTRLVANDGNNISIKHTPTEIYIFCVLSEHYPALAFQASQFLKTETTETIQPPFVMDVFTLDAMTEMLNTPLYFLSYVNRRVGYANKIMSSHELTILSYHLKQNLWINQKYNGFHLGDDVSMDLDVAMIARREGLPGKKIPEGILTKYANSSIGKLIKQIEQTEEPASIALGFMLLTLNEDTINQLSTNIDTIRQRALIESNHHNVTIGVGDGKTGITIHTGFDSDQWAKERLLLHCERKKYTQHADTWYGLCLRPQDGNIRFGISLNFPWAQSYEMDRYVADFPEGNQKMDLKQSYVQSGKKKIGRNDPCTCGSGRKYKKCCLNRN